jgi:hypothetical protein
VFSPFAAWDELQFRNHVRLRLNPIRISISENGAAAGPLVDAAGMHPSNETPTAVARFQEILKGEFALAGRTSYCRPLRWLVGAPNTYTRGELRGYRERVSDSGRKVAALATQLRGLTGVTIIASTPDNLGHKSNRKLAPVHGRIDNPLCNLSM